MERVTLKERLLKPWEDDNGADYRFLQYYVCQPLPESRRSEFDNTNKVIMPLSALDRLTRLNISYPMMFSVHNPLDDAFYNGFESGRICHCGVLEFTADEGFVHMPRWMMDRLVLTEGDLVFFESTTLPKGTYVKLQPHTTDFVSLSDPKAVLEKTLKEYSCLTTGDTVTIVHNGKQFSINIVETRPGKAIDIVDTDCEVDFIAPLDYKEPQKTASKVEKTKTEDGEKEEKDDEFIPFKGLGRRLGGRPRVESSGALCGLPGTSKGEKDDVFIQFKGLERRPDQDGRPCEESSRDLCGLKGTPKEDKDDEFIPFKGLGRRLDGMPCVESSGKPKLKEVAGTGRSICIQSSCQTGKGRKSGKQVFGSEPKSGDNDKKLSEAKDEDVHNKGKTDKFQPFTGQKRTLI